VITPDRLSPQKTFGVCWCEIFFYRIDVLPIIQPTVSKLLCTFHSIYNHVVLIILWPFISSLRFQCTATIGLGSNDTRHKCNVSMTFGNYTSMWLQLSTQSNRARFCRSLIAVYCFQWTSDPHVHRWVLASHAVTTRVTGSVLGSTAARLPLSVNINSSKI